LVGIGASNGPQAALLVAIALAAALVTGSLGCKNEREGSPAEEILGGSQSQGTSRPTSPLDPDRGGTDPVLPAGLGSTGTNFLNVETFPLGLVVDGGVGRDGIEAVTDPVFVPAGSVGASYLADTDLVIGVVLNGEAKAYPHNILWWHEIVNDAVGGHPVVVSLCPLTGTGMVFDGADAGTRITMGVSGWLFNNNLILYDRRDDETLYPQMTQRAILGPRRGQELILMPVLETTWRYWKRLHPSTRVVSGSGLRYALAHYRGYPYPDYRDPSSPPLFPLAPELAVNPIGKALEPKQTMLGVRHNESAKSYPFDTLGEEAVINDRIGNLDVVVVHHKKERLAIPYDRRVEVDGVVLTLTFDWSVPVDLVFPFTIRDRETLSVWNLMGEAIEGRLAGMRLRQVPAHSAYWFAWATFWQESQIL
jgi:hypothetical protein